MTGLRVIKPGPLSLLQDEGRLGWRHLGVSSCGPLDRHAAAWANRLLDNPWGTPLLEIALGYLELESQLDTWLALTGAELAATLDGEALLPWARFAIRAGQRLKLDYARSGQRAYLAVAGGFRAPPVLGSVSTQAREGLGGLSGQGEPLRAGDLLPCRPARFAGSLSVPWRYRPDYRAIASLRVITGGDASGFDEQQVRAFFAQTWQLSPQSDRMGARLQGEALMVPRRQWSLGVSRGRSRCRPMASRSSSRPTTRPWGVPDPRLAASARPEPPGPVPAAPRPAVLSGKPRRGPGRVARVLRLLRQADPLKCRRRH